MGEMMRENDPEKLERVMAAILTMKKFDLEAIKRASAGKGSTVPDAELRPFTPTSSWPGKL